jgi:thiamine transporter ThiT
MSKSQLKQALISILIGAITIFITTLLQGLIDFLQSWMSLGAGGVVASAVHFKQTFKF